MDIGIYKIYWTNCKYVYIGQSIHLKRRKGQHISQLLYKNHRNKRLQRVFNKYGHPQFEIVEICEVDQLTIKEQFWMDFYKGRYLCNNAPFAGGSCRGIKRSRAFIENLIKVNTGTKKSLETRMKISEKAKARLPGTRVNCGTKKGTKFSAETNLKKSVNCRLAVTDEKRRRDRDNMIKRNLIGARNPTAKLVLDMETGIYYGTLKEASMGHRYNYAYLKTMVAGSNRNKTNFIYA